MRSRICARRLDLAALQRARGGRNAQLLIFHGDVPGLWSPSSQRLFGGLPPARFEEGEVVPAPEILGPSALRSTMLSEASWIIRASTDWSKNCLNHFSFSLTASSAALRSVYVDHEALPVEGRACSSRGHGRRGRRLRRGAGGR